MTSTQRHLGGLLVAILLFPAAVAAGPLSVEVSTDRGHEAVYQPGQALEIRARSSEDAYLLVYEIDAEGYVHVLYPHVPGDEGQVEGERTYRLPEDEADELVAQGPTGQGYIVALASLDPFVEFPWYLRPYDVRAQEIGYSGAPEEGEEGVTAEGRIVGDPFVAMERIRRRVLRDPEDEEAFASAYTSYYIHQRVQYPRYLCDDCHRPGRWNWWAGYDPYYTQCSVFDLRVNWGWSWGQPYWFGHVPYYVYVYRNDCPPRYRHFRLQGSRHSSWDGWKRWRTLWGGDLVRYKPTAPPGYVPPSKYDEAGGRYRGRRPPGFLAGDPGSVRVPRPVPVGRQTRLGAGDPGSSDPPRTPRSRVRERGDLYEQPTGRLRRSDGSRDPQRPQRPKVSERGDLFEQPVGRVRRSEGNREPARDRSNGRRRGFEPEPVWREPPAGRPSRERRSARDWQPSPAPEPVARPSRERRSARDWQPPPAPEPVARPSRERRSVQDWQPPPPPEPVARPSREQREEPVRPRFEPPQGGRTERPTYDRSRGGGPRRRDR